MQDKKLELINYIKKETAKRHYPTRRFIERKFRLRLTGLFTSINDLYQQAGIIYKQRNSQELKNKKAKILQEIVLEILPRLNLKLINERKTHERGIDILAQDNKGKIIGLEIKAHHKYEPIKRRNIKQLERFLQQEKLNRIILVTTSSKINAKSKFRNIEMITYKNLKSFCSEGQIKRLGFIRNKSVHQETKERERKRKLILDYVKAEINRGRWVTQKDIIKNVGLDPLTYFKNLSEMYIKANIKIPFSKMGSVRNKKLRNSLKRKLYNQAKEYVKSEVLKGNYPSGIDIQKKFEVGHIWNFFKTTTLYRELGIPHYFERNLRTS